MTRSAETAIGASPPLRAAWLAGGGVGLVAALALAGVVPAQAALLLAVAAVLCVIAARYPLALVTAVAMPALAVVSNLPAPLQIAGRNLRYIFIVVPPLLGVWALWMVAQRRTLRVPHWPALTTLLGLFLGVTILRSPLRSLGLGTTALLAFNVAVYGLTAWAIVSGRAEALRLAIVTLFGAVSVYAAAGLAVVLGHVAGLLPPGFGIQQWDVAELAQSDVSGKVIAPMGFWTVTGSYFAAAAVVALGLVLRGEASLRRWAALGLVAGTVGMLLSYSRGPLLGFMFGAILVLAFLGRQRLGALVSRLAAVAVAIAAPAAVLVAVVPDARAALLGRLSTLFDLRAATTADRLVLWGRMLADVARHPVLGNGADAFRVYRDPGYPAESWPIEVVHATGLVGLACLAWFVGAIALAAWRTKGALGPIALACLAGFLALNLSVSTNPGAWGTFYWVLAGLAAAAPFATAPGVGERESA